MAIVGAVNQAAPQQQHVLAQTNLQDARVTAVSKPFFQRVKETLTRIWSATVIGVKASFDKVSFVFFRVLEWIHPSLGPKIENVFLRIGNIVQAIKDAWKEEEVRKEMDGLRTDNRDLRARVQLLTGVSEQNERLNLDLTQLRGQYDLLNQAHRFLDQTKAGLEQRVQALHIDQTNILQREQAAIRYRDAVVIQNTDLKKENEELLAQRNATGQALLFALHANTEIRQRLTQFEQEATDLRVQLRQNKDLDQHFGRIAQACDQVRVLGQKTELDDDLEQLLPLLLQQIQTASTNLQLAKRNLPPHSSAEIPIQSLERILVEVVSYLNRIPKALQLHANWQQPVNQILYRQQVEV